VVDHAAVVEVAVAAVTAAGAPPRPAIFEQSAGAACSLAPQQFAPAAGGSALLPSPVRSEHHPAVTSCSWAWAGSASVSDAAADAAAAARPPSPATFRHPAAKLAQGPLQGSPSGTSLRHRPPKALGRGCQQTAANRPREIALTAKAGPRLQATAVPSARGAAVLMGLPAASPHRAAAPNSAAQAERGVSASEGVHTMARSTFGGAWATWQRCLLLLVGRRRAGCCQGLAGRLGCHGYMWATGADILVLAIRLAARCGRLAGLLAALAAFLHLYPAALRRLH